MSTAREQAKVLADLLSRERLALADFLVALAAFDRERRWADLGHASLFAFLVKDLGLSNGAAAYRRAAVELVQRFPQVVEPIRDGRLCMTTVFELSPEPPPTRTVVTPARAEAIAVARSAPSASPAGRLADQVRANFERE